MEWNEENLEEFIKNHKGMFDTYDPSVYHGNKFFYKLQKHFRKIIDITPYIVKLGIVVVFVFLFSFITWRQFICGPMTHVSLKNLKTEQIYKLKNRRLISEIKTYTVSPEEIAEFNVELQNFDNEYKSLSKILKKSHSDMDLLNMYNFYIQKINFLDYKLENYKSIN